MDQEQKDKEFERLYNSLPIAKGNTERIQFVKQRILQIFEEIYNMTDHSSAISSGVFYCFKGVCGNQVCDRQCLECISFVKTTDPVKTRKKRGEQPETTT